MPSRAYLACPPRQGGERGSLIANGRKQLLLVSTEQHAAEQQ